MVVMMVMALVIVAVVTVFGFAFQLSDGLQGGFGVYGGLFDSICGTQNLCLPIANGLLALPAMKHRHGKPRELPGSSSRRRLRAEDALFHVKRVRWDGQTGGRALA